MIAKISDFVKAHFNNIILFIIVALLILLSFAVGFIMAKERQKQPIQFLNAYSATHSFIS